MVVVVSEGGAGAVFVVPFRMVSLVEMYEFGDLNMSVANARKTRLDI